MWPERITLKNHYLLITNPFKQKASNMVWFTDSKIMVYWGLESGLSNPSIGEFLHKQVCLCGGTGWGYLGLWQPLSPQRWCTQPNQRCVCLQRKMGVGTSEANTVPSLFCDTAEVLWGMAVPFPIQLPPWRRGKVKRRERWQYPSNRDDSEA